MLPRRLTVMVAVLLLCAFVLTGCGLLGSREYKAEIPKTPPKNSLVIFNFAPSGDADAKYYGYGFARALRDRLASLGPTLILQRSPYSSEAPLAEQLDNPAHRLSNEQAIMVTKTMGARHAAVGEMALSDGDVRIEVRLFDTQSPGRVKALDASGKIADLPKIQVSLARQLVSAMDLRPDSRQTKALGKANFTKPEVLVHVTKGRITKDWKTAEAELWRAHDADPGSRLAITELFRIYSDFEETKWKDVADNDRLQKLLEEAEARYANDPDMLTELSWVSIRRYRYAAAQDMLERVLEIEPRSVPTFHALAYLAMYRQDTELAVQSAREIVSLWPSDPVGHAVLAEAFGDRASFARQQYEPDQLTEAQRRKWESDSLAALAEANAVVKAYPDCKRAWYVIMERSQDIGRPTDARKAFNTLVRLDPKEPRFYMEYIRGIVRTRGAATEAERAMAISDKNLSVQDAYAVRGWSVLSSRPTKSQLADVVRMADKSLSLPGKQKMYPLNLKCRALMDLGRSDQALQVARKGYAEDPSPSWQQLLAHGLLRHWEKKRDRVVLNQATRLYADYTREVPYDPHGHMQLAGCYWELRDRESATREYERVAELDPSNKYVVDWVRKTKYSRFWWGLMGR